MITERLQQHTVKTYDLENKAFQVKRVKARTLLTPRRFDLFAKLFYISHRNEDKPAALAVYLEHIKAFNPDGKEPGRDDKTSADDFVSVFDRLIDHFADHEFDETISVIPVDEDGIILDGSHRVAALAYYDKDVTVVCFDDVKSHGTFDYNYFMNRGMSWDICDTVAAEMARWQDNMLAACLWPAVGDDAAKQQALRFIAQKHIVAYVKKLNVDLKSLSNFVGTIYQEQDWTKSQPAVQDKALRCYGNKSKSLWVAFFATDCSLEDTLGEKESLRQLFGKGKDSLHITDNHRETLQIAGLVLDKTQRDAWLAGGYRNRLADKLSEKVYYFKKVTWINFKVAVARLLRR